MADLEDDQPADFYYQDDLYIERPEEKFSCPICLCPVQREAHLTECCGRHYCLACIVRIRNDRKPCPMCKAAPLVIFPNKERQREIKQLQVRCPLSLPPYRQLFSGRGQDSAATVQGAKEVTSSASCLSGEIYNTTDRAEPLKKSNDESVCDAIKSEISIAVDTSRTSINDALLKVSTGVKDADDIYDSVTKSTSSESCKSKLGEESSGGERSGRVADRTQIVDLSSIHEKHQNPEQISVEGEGKKVVNIATNDSDKSNIGKECSGQTIKECGGDQTTVEANLDEESPQDEKISVAGERKEVDGERDSSRNRGWWGERATEECGVKPTMAEVERKKNIEVIKNGGDGTLCNWRGELGQVERHVKDVHGSEALKQITKEDNPPSNTAQHHRQQPCPVHSQHSTHHCPVHHHHHHGNVVPNISFHHVHRTQRGVNIHHQVPGHSQYSLDSDNSHQISPQVSLSEAREQAPLNSVASAQQSLGLNFGRIRVSFPVEGQSMSSDVSGDRTDRGGGRLRESVTQTHGSHTTPHVSLRPHGPPPPHGPPSHHGPPPTHGPSHPHGPPPPHGPPHPHGPPPHRGHGPRGHPHHRHHHPHGHYRCHGPP